MLKASYCISYLSDREARGAQVPKLCANVKERLKKKEKKNSSGKKEKCGKGGVFAWFPEHFLLSCLLVYRLYPSTAKNGLLFPRHGIAAAESDAADLAIVESSAHGYSCIITRREGSSNV